MHKIREAYDPDRPHEKRFISIKLDSKSSTKYITPITLNFDKVLPREHFEKLEQKHSNSLFMAYNPDYRKV